MGFVSDQYTVNKANLFEEVGDILFEILTEPVIKDGMFNEDYFQQERENLIQRIGAELIINVLFAGAMYGRNVL